MDAQEDFHSIEARARRSALLDRISAEVAAACTGSGVPRLAGDAVLSWSRLGPDGCEIGEVGAAGEAGDAGRVGESGEDGATRRLIRHTLSAPAGSWVTRCAEIAGGDVVASLCEHTDLLRLSRRRVLRFVTSEEGPDAAELVEAMTFEEGDELGEAGQELLEAPFEEGDDLESRLPPGCSWHHVGATIDHLRVLGLRELPATGSVSTADAEPPVAVLWDPFEEDLAAETLGRLYWHSESGGAPISWDGSNELCRLNGRLGLARQDGDLGYERELVELPADDAGLAELLASWIADNGMSAIAAFELEPLDPRGRLGEPDRNSWESLLEGLWDSAGVSVGGPLERVREKLRQESVYARVAGALADPQGSDGRYLHGLLSEFDEHGVIGMLINIDWP